MNTAMMTVSEAVDQLVASTVKWVQNGLPDVDGLVKFEASAEQFLLIQEICSGSKLGTDLATSVKYLVDREAELEECTDEDGYQSWPYCSSGWARVEDVLYLWYETTSGTVFSHAVAEDGEQAWEVYLPQGRLKGSHHYEISRVMAGMTREQYHRWYNSHCLEGREAEYAEEAAFHNEHMVPLGWERRKTGAQFVAHRKMDQALQYVYGEWAMQYGIGEKIRDILGPDGEAWNSGCPRPMLTGDERLEKAQYVLRRLKEATSEWQKIVEEWSSAELSVCTDDDSDYADDDSDYDF